MILGGLELVEDFAPEMNVSAATLREWCARGEFPHIKYPGKRRVFIPRAWGEMYLAGNCELELKPLARGGRICKPKGAK